MISSGPSPKLEDPELFSDQFNKFVSVCLTQIPDQRPSAIDLLSVFA